MQTGRILIMNPTSSFRYPEIDFFRFFALLGMIIFHAAFDLNFWGVTTYDLAHGAWLALARFVQMTFMVTTGITLVLSTRRVQARNVSYALYPRLRHAVKILVAAMMVTLITWVLFGEQAVFFGVLHFYAVALLLALPLLSFGVWNILFGSLILLFSKFFPISFDGLWAIPLGFYSGDFVSLDYFPLFPWFGIFLQGVGFASWFYKAHGRRFVLPYSFPMRLHTFLQAIVRHSLFIYLLHQPILLGLTYFLK
ncbi:MAG: hypothetical protein ACD_28C00111G0003 [uncultured bacterium]|nr:MAG: hypothetical protein ACD_28C00111G0003 [uncultured bacterium]